MNYQKLFNSLWQPSQKVLLEPINGKFFFIFFSFFLIFLFFSPGVHRVTKAFLPLLRASSNGRIINLISFCTDCPLPMLAVYTASKAALRSYSAGLRMELSKFGVPVVMFNPGDHPGETALCANQVTEAPRLSSKQRVSVLSHALPRGRLGVWFPARAYWTQRSNLTRKYLFPSDHRTYIHTYIQLSMI